MKQYGNTDARYFSSLPKGRKVNHLGGVSSSINITPDQLGVSITKSVFGWKYPASGAKAANGGDLGTNTQASQYIDEYGLPFIFVVGGNQILLPPVVQRGGTAVPYLPDGLSVIYAPSFMGVPIPADMIKPISFNGKLRFSIVEMPSAQNAYSSMTSRAVGSWTNALLINNGVDNGVNKGETLIRILMAVMECLIYSYSSYPWGNEYNDLSDACMTKRNIDDMLIYPYQKGTFLGNLTQQLAPIFSNPAVQAAVNVAEPGAGTALAQATSAEAKAASVQQQPQLVNPNLTTQIIPSSSPFGSVASSLTSSPILLIIIVAIVIFLIVKK